MAEAKNFCFCCFSVLLLLLSGGELCAEGRSSEGWPERLGKRKQYRLEYGYVYARTKSAAATANKLIADVSEEMDAAGRKKAVKGLVLVMDKKEKQLIDVKKLIELAESEDDPVIRKNTQKALESVKNAKKQAEELGIDLDLLVSAVPIKIEPAVLPKVVADIPEELVAELDFCVIVPTKSNTKYVMKKVLSAVMKHKKVGLLQRIALIPLMPFIEKNAVSELMKNQRFAIFKLLLDKQYNLTEEEKEERIKAYRDKMGLGEEESVE